MYLYGIMLSRNLQLMIFYLVINLPGCEWISLNNWIGDLPISFVSPRPSLNLNFATLKWKVTKKLMKNLLKRMLFCGSIKCAKIIVNVRKNHQTWKVNNFTKFWKNFKFCSEFAKIVTSLPHCPNTACPVQGIDGVGRSVTNWLFLFQNIPLVEFSVSWLCDISPFVRFSIYQV